jgi:ribosomal 30S subunit maturation factor RimM
LPQQPELQVKLVEMGRISAPFGIKGWVKIQPYVPGGEQSLKNYGRWYVTRESGWRETRVEATAIIWLPGWKDVVIATRPPC